MKKCGEFYEIVYLCPITEELIKELYYSYVYENQSSCDKLLNYSLIKEGGKDFLFEQIVIQNLKKRQLFLNLYGN